MERMEKWLAGLKDRPLLQAAIVAGAFAVLWIFALLYTPYAHPTYTEDEITPEACAEILEDASRVKSEMFYIGKEPCEHRIFVGYTTTDYPDNYTEPVLLEFVLDADKKGEYRYEKCHHSFDEIARDVALFRISDASAIVVNNNSRLHQIVGIKTGKIYWQTDPITGPEMYLFRYYGEELAVLDAGGETIR